MEKVTAEPGETETPACQQWAVQIILNSQRSGRGGVGMPCEAAGRLHRAPSFTVPTPRAPAALRAQG